MTTRTRTAAAGVGLLMAAAAASAGDCTPTWDPEFGVPGINTGIAFDLTVHDGTLYTSGTFTSIGGTSASRIASWDGTSWNALGSGLSGGEGYAMASFDGSLYAAGYFNSAGGVDGTAKIARWDGSSWNSLGAQLELFSNQLWDLKTWDDGTGEALYVVGNYQNAGGVADASFISKWDGLSFSPLGAPIGGAVPLIIFTAEVWDDGTGEALYVGGRFLTIDGVPASRIAKYDGTEWSALGTGLTGPGATPSVMAMAAFDDGTGEALYVAGQTFNSAGGTPVNRIARWDGTEWSAVGDGFANGIVWDLTVFDDGSGPALYATGTFTASGSTPLRGLAKWDGTSWTDVGDTDDDTYSSLVFDDGTGPALHVAGRYSTIGGVTASGIARLSSCVTSANPGDVNGDGSVDTSDLLLVLSSWGPCEKGDPCVADLDDSGNVNVQDLLEVLANWS
jgi:hypothetical protein